MWLALRVLAFLALLIPLAAQAQSMPGVDAGCGQLKAKVLKRQQRPRTAQADKDIEHQA